MRKLPLCRICLSVNVKNSNIINHELQEIYQTFTCVAFNTEDRRPNIVCNYCMALLKKALGLKIDCLAAEDVLSQFLNSKDKSLGEFAFPVTSKQRLQYQTLEQINIDSKYAEIIGNVADSGIVDMKAKVNFESDPLSACDEERDGLTQIKLDLESLKVEMKQETDSNDDTVTPVTTTLKSKTSTPFHQKKMDSKKDRPKNLIKTNKRTGAAHATDTLPSANLKSDRVKDCNVQFNSQKEITEHYSITNKTCSNKKKSAIYKNYKYQCPNCPMKFMYPYAIKRHSLTHRNERPFKCGHCDRDYRYSRTLINHVRNIHPEVNHVDVTAGKKIYETITMKELIKDETQKCHICQNDFKNKNALYKHLSIHGLKPYECDVCQKRFKNRQLLVMHIRLTHSDETPFKCDKCPLAFKQAYQLRVHYYTHTGIKPYKCSICEKDFIHKTGLTTHLRTHSGEKPFKCDQCWKSFTQVAHFKTHCRTHTGDKPYQCKICFKHFSRSHVLIKHLRFHTGEKPYKCNVCGKQFTQNYSKVVHMRTHTGEKPYPCNVCPKRFRSTDNLKRHNRVHTGSKPYQCDICQRGFAASGAVKRHMSTVHRNVVKQCEDKNKVNGLNLII